MTRPTLTAAIAAWALASAAPCFAAEPDPASLYELSTQGSSERVKKGDKGKLVLEIKPSAKAHVSEEAPLKLELSGKALAFDKQKLTLKDSVATKAPGQQYAAPRFEVPFVGGEAGKTAAEAKLTFFICTESLCARQQKTLTVPVQVDEK